MRNIAKRLLSAGINVIPKSKDSKQPHGAWGRWQDELYAGSMKHFQNGMGVVSGSVSGGLFVWDVDGGKSALDELREGVLAVKSDILNNVVLERSPSKGFHLAYLCPSAEKIGRLVWKRNDKVLLECRGEKCFTVISPTTGYELLQGDWGNLPVFSTLEHELFLSVANKMGEETGSVKSVDREVKRESVRSSRADLAGMRRGELTVTGSEAKSLFDDDAPTKILKALGCIHVSTAVCTKNWFGQLGNPVEYWKRPGKGASHHGICLFPNIGLVYVHTDECPPLIQGAGYTPLDLFATVVLGLKCSTLDGRGAWRRAACGLASNAIRCRKWEGFKAEHSAICNL